jgi:TonB-linked SusC/RagA family outer membrane protein
MPNFISLQIHTSMKRKLQMKLKTLLMVFLFLGGSMSLFAQNLEVTGVISEAGTGELLIGATVLQKGTTNGTVCDVMGKYKISVPKGAVLKFSLIGYVTQEITVEKEGPLDVVMVVQVTTLDDVIVIGYSTQKKSDKTGAVSTVKSDDLNGGVITNPIQAMQGKAAGVLVSKKGGDPSENFSVRIRGASGFSSNTQPLYVIDGIPGADPNIVSPDDIESYNILKDAASTAIYGSRGSNGVILITTKKGKATGTAKDGVKDDGAYSNIEFSTQVSIENVAKKLPVLSASEMRDFSKTLLAKAQIAHPNYTMDSVFIDGGATTNWQDEIYRTGIGTQNSLSFSGGNKHNSYLASVTNSNWEGTMKGTSKDITTARISATQKALKDKLTLAANLMGAFEKNDYENYGGWGKDDIIYQAISRNPTDPVYDSAGGYYKSQRVYSYENPIAVINEVTNNRNAKKFLGSLKADLEIVDGLVASVNLGYIHDDNTTNYFRPANLYASADNGFGKKQYNAFSSKLIEVTGVYSKNFNKTHNLNALLGYSWQENVYNGFYSQGGDAQSTYAGPENLAVLNDVKWGDIGSWKGQSNLIGFFGRVQYNFKSRYFISGSLRRDGSSKFGDNNKWGWFPTAAIGWSLDQEKWLSNVKWVNQLKLRASYGISGNQEIGEYRSMVLWEPSGKAVNPETGKEVITFKPAWNANPDLKWEQTSEYNVGIDFGFLNSRLSGSIEVYYKVTDDLLGEYNVPVPPNLAQRTFANSGSMSNTGIELYVQAYPISTKTFTWKTSLTASHNKTEILDLGSYFNEKDGVRKEGYVSGRGMVGDLNYVTGIMVGEEIGSFYVPTYVTMKNGIFIYESISGGYTDKLSEAKRTVVATAAPKVELGWSNLFTLGKHWSLDFALRAWIGNHVYNATEMFFDNPGNLPSLNALPSAIDWYNQGRVSGPSIADIYVENASFLKLDYISLAYDFNVSKISWLKKLSLYISANNVFTITGYSGVDPETTVNGLSFGIDQYNVYPKTRAYTAGLKVSF